MALCSAEGCPKEASASRGWCWGHYERWLKHGDPLAGRMSWNGDHSARFWSKVSKTTPERQPGTQPCWYWEGVIKGGGLGDGGGYGYFAVAGVSYYAHRWAYLELVGPIPAGRDLDHLCRNRPCVNPAHLEPVTRAENLRRGRLLRQPITQCIRGHSYDEANTRLNRKGARVCRSCDRQRRRRQQD